MCYISRKQKVEHLQCMEADFWKISFFGLLILLTCIILPAPAICRDISMVVLLDRSGSMGATDPNGLAVPAAGYILDELRFREPTAKAGIVLFSSGISVYPKDTGFSSNLRSLIDDLKKFPLPEGQTEMSGALKKALNMFALEKGEKQLVILTDGAPTSIMPDQFTGQFKAAVNDYIKTKDVDKIGKILQGYILQELKPSLDQSGIQIIPIGFAGADEVFLKQLASSGAGEKVDSVTQLIPSVDRLIPKGEKIFSFVTDTGSDEFIFDIPLGAEAMRVALLYDQPGKKTDNVTITLVDPQKGIHTGNEEDYLQINNRSGSKAFERLIIQNPGQGAWVLKSTRKELTYEFPAAKLVVEIKTSGALSASASPNQLCQGESSKVGVTFQDASGKALPLVGVNGSLAGEKGAVLENISFSPDAQHTYWNTLQVPTNIETGKKTLFISAGLTDRFIGRLSLPITVAPIEACKCPIQLKAEIPYARDKASMKQDQLVFPAIGSAGTLEALIEGVRLRIPIGSLGPACRPPFRLELVISPLMSEAGDILTGSAKWITLTPSKGNITEKDPFVFNVGVTMPEEFASDLKDGTYSGVIVKCCVWH